MRPAARWVGAVAGLALLGLTGCAGSGHATARATTTAPGGPGTAATTTTAPAPSTAATTTTAPVRPTTAATTATTKPAAPVTTHPVTTSAAASAAGVSGALTGKVIAIDPGHNGGNFSDPSYINQTIFNGRSSEACDTTGAETNGGYTEAQFNWNVALDLSADLRAQGATVVLTRTSNTGIGPCVTQRAAIGNQAHANAAVSIHADGGPASGRGFAILEPVADGINNAIVAPSATLGTDLRNAFLTGAGEPVSSYDGANGIAPRNDLAGTNLSTVPKVFIECANMRNGTDAALITSPAWQAQAAQAIAAGLRTFLTGA